MIIKRKVVGIRYKIQFFRLASAMNRVLAEDPRIRVFAVNDEQRAWADHVVEVKRVEGGKDIVAVTGKQARRSRVTTAFSLVVVRSLEEGW